MSGLTVFEAYAKRLSRSLDQTDWAMVEPLAEAFFDAWRERRQVFIAGNGGSAANANHMANDYVYPISKTPGKGMRVRSLCANPAVVTCLANDEGYENIFSAQLPALANPGDVLLVLSGSGNSPNILRLLETAREIGVTSFAILGFSGGKAKGLADHVLHFPGDDMQVAEDLQMVVSNMIVQYLYSRRDEIE